MNAFIVASAPPAEATLVAFFAARGATLVDAPVLQPAEPYLDTAGEALRRRIFLTRGENGEHLCLRPDWTIPVCLAHLRSGEDAPRRYAYRGAVFRQAPGSPEFAQGGIEDLGDPDRAGADARALADALAALRLLGVPDAPVLLGDRALFESFLGALGLAEGWQRRLLRTFGRNDLMNAALAALAEPAPLVDIDPALLGDARRRDLASLAAKIEARMEAAGLPPNRGRSGAEIAARLAEKVTVADTRLGAAELARLRDFLAIDCPLGQAEERLERLADRSGANLGGALAFFRARNRALEQAGIRFETLRYRAGFGRPLDYYTGLVFEVGEGPEPLAGGGRYDRLLHYLGAPAPLPAVGFSLWLDRVAALAAVGKTA